MLARVLAASALLLVVSAGQVPAGAAEVAEVVVGDSYFAPETVTVTVGSTVRWTQTGSLPHSVTADDGSFDSHPACPAAACMRNGEVYTRTFTQPGVIPYYCKVHGSPGGGGHAGVVRVVDETGVVPTSVTTLTATAGSGTISVSGNAALGEQAPVVVGQDGPGDAPGGAAATALGLDMDQLRISRPNASTNSLLFTIKLAGMANGGIPETVMYNWDINVDGGASGGGGSWSIKTMRTRAVGTQNTNPYAGVHTCVPATGGFTCTQTTSLNDVAYDQARTEIRMVIPLSAIGAKPGSLIEAWPRSTNPFWVGVTAAGERTVTNVFDTGTHEEYVVPGPTMKLGVAPVGQPISYSRTGTVNDAGAFSGSLPAPASPGTYEVGVQVCFGTNCATASRPVTV